MKKITLASISTLLMFVMSGCSSNSSQNNLANNSQDSTTTKTQKDERYANGLGQIQAEQYKVVVLPTNVNLENQTGLPISNSTLSYTLTHEITTALYETHRFFILASDGDSNTTEKPDFYLKSTINQLDNDETIRILKTTGQGVEEKTISANVLYQLIDAKSNKVAFSHSLNYQLKSATYNEKLSTTINNTLKSLANLMKTEIINEIYPIRIISTENGQIILDQPLPIGSYCNINQLGKKLNNVYTDSLLGYEQKSVGKLLITHSSSVMAYGELVEGQVSKGNICKPVAGTFTSAPDLIKFTPQGGVVLPFD